MLIRGSKEYGTMILNGVEYNSIFNNGIEYGFTSSGNFRPRTQAVIDYATTNGYTLSSTLNALDVLIGTLEDSGVLDKLDLFYCFFGDGDANFKTINIVDVAKYKGTPQPAVINVLGGLKGSGTVDGIIYTGFIADNYEGKYQYLNASRGYYLTDRSDIIDYTTGTVDGLEIGLNRQCMSAFADVRQRINSDRNSINNTPAFLTTANNTTVVLNRTSTNVVQIQVLGLGASNYTQYSVAQSFGYQTILFRNSSFFGKPKLGAYFAGSVLNGTDVTNIDNALKAYKLAVGA